LCDFGAQKNREPKITVTCCYIGCCLPLLAVFCGFFCGAAEVLKSAETMQTIVVIQVVHEEPNWINTDKSAAI
jgi:hypothetical protein